MPDSANVELYWFLIGVVLMLAEMVIPGFVIFFFGIGAWITAACVWIGIADSFNIQLIIFLVSSILTLILFRKEGQKYFKGRVSGKMDDVAKLDDLSGEHATVIEKIVPHRSGKVEFHGTSWNADADMEIPKGATVEILSRKNLTLIVKPVQ